MTNKKPEKKIEHEKPAEIVTEPAPTETVNIDEVLALKNKLIEADDKYLRLYAEFDNYRKRTTLEKQEFSKYAVTNLVEQILPVLDCFEHSRGSFQNEKTAKEDLQKGFALIHKMLEDTLQKVGVVRIEAKGKQFDPFWHEAIMQKPAVEPAGTILEEMQPGYKIHDKLLRPAMVIVAAENKEENK